MHFLKAYGSILTKCIGVRSLSTSSCSWAVLKTLQEKVCPYTKIHINCAYNLKIVPYDLLDCPDSNILRVSVNQEDSDNGISVKVSEHLVNITGDPNSSHLECLLEVPIKADLQVHNSGNTSIADMYSEEIEVTSTGNIETKSLRSTDIKLYSTNGNIVCRGITLAEAVVAVTTGKGNIFLDKLQGGSVTATTEAGKITVNASYATKSSFQTAEGDLELKSIHKHCTVRSSSGKSLVMNGFYGTLDANVGSESVILQLSEMVGESSIQASSTQTLQLNLAETVYETASITVISPKLKLDSNIDDKVHQRNGNIFKFGNPTTGNTLHVESNGSLVLRKMSWEDSFTFGGKSLLKH